MYNHKSIEAKWQNRWEEAGAFKASDSSKKPKFYALMEFPYPSGAGLHVGHVLGYTAMDIISRKRRMEGYEVLYPMGWDAFGLPAENYAIKTGRKPAEVTAENVAEFKRQMQSIGFSFDWDREINTTDPAYYKWTQWMFLEFFKAGLAYKKAMPINWCLSCKIGLANEEVVGGVCERCGGEVEKRNKEQWMIAITKYADRLIDDLETVDYLPKIKKQQIDWIGRSEGAEIKFSIQGVQNVQDVKGVDLANEQIKRVAKRRLNDLNIDVFTTRPDTLFGATYMVLAPEHELIKNLKSRILNFDEVSTYVKDAAAKADIDRTNDELEKTGVQLNGVKAINPANGEEIPVWVADYVLPNYGTGAIMAVPAHDERDFAFATKYKLPIVEVVAGGDISKEAFINEGKAVNSNFLNGLETVKAKSKMIEWLEKEGHGKGAINYKLRDWVFSRQRYWGEPIPLVWCDACDVWNSLPEDQLPLELPDVEKYEPTDSGESPLAAIDDWVNTTCPKCDGPAKRETDTMPNWAGSSWYYLRYTDAQNDKVFADKKKLKHWMQVDWYNGGMEHTTLHLLYSRFWNKFLFDQGHVSTSEPYAKRTSHGLIMAEDGTKMSKSKGNVVNPNEIVGSHGADTLRVYEMFMGPFDQPVPWNEQGVKGVRKFLDKVERLSGQIVSKESETVTKSLHQTIKKVTEDIESMSFNTAVAQMMIFVNTVNDEGGLTEGSLALFVGILSPFAPHLAEEMYERNGKGLLMQQSWPKFDPKLVVESVVTIGVQVNGKVRGDVTITIDASEADARAAAEGSENVTKYLDGKPVKKFIYVQGKIINFVV
jgi:leucyl-tRNA synthetase